MKIKQLTPPQKLDAERGARLRSQINRLTALYKPIGERLVAHAGGEDCVFRFNDQVLYEVEYKKGREKCDVKTLRLKFADAALACIHRGDPYAQIEFKTKPAP